MNNKLFSFLRELCMVYYEKNNDIYKEDITMKNEEKITIYLKDEEIQKLLDNINDEINKIEEES